MGTQNGITVEVKGNTLVITAPIEEPTRSKSGKTLVVASTRGNLKTNASIDGKAVVVGFNAYVYA